MNAYENSPLREITGNCLRPGGLDLTRRGLGLCGFKPGARLLDLGCGPGATLALLRCEGYACLGLDRSLPLLQEARSHAPAVRADFARLPFASGSFDGVLCECGLSLARQREKTLRECLRTLKPGGRLLLTDIILLPGEIGGEDSLPPRPVGSAGALPLAQLTRLLTACGFTLLHTQDHSRLMRELAAHIIWNFGSLAAFSGLWGTAPDAAQRPCGCPSEEKLGYTLIIAEKKEEQ